MLMKRKTPLIRILLSAQNTSYCILIALSKWIEFFISKGHMENTDFAIGIHGQNDLIRIKEKAADFIKNILNDDGFSSKLEVNHGTHSIIKMEITIARRCRGSKYETDTITCWKQRRQQDSYADTIIPWPDKN